MFNLIFNSIVPLCHPAGIFALVDAALDDNCIDLYEMTFSLFSDFLAHIYSSIFNPQSENL